MQQVSLMTHLLRFLLLFALLVSLNISHALVIVPPEERPQPTVTIKSREVKTQIEGIIARTTVRETLLNNSPVALEGSFLIPVAADSQITDFSMTVNGKKISAEVLDQDEARRMYEQIVRKRRDPALLEFIDARTYRVRIFPVPANDTALIEYQIIENVKREAGVYRWRLNPLGDASDAREAGSSFEVVVKGEKPLGVINCTTHDARIERTSDGRSATVTLPGGMKLLSPFELLYAFDEGDNPIHLVATKQPDDEKGYFFLMLSPPRTGVLTETLPKNAIFVLDTSGSMADEGKFDKAISALRQCLGALSDADTFNVITFSTDVDFFRPEPVPATNESITQAKAWLDKRRASGGTNIYAALEAALQQGAKQKGDDRVCQVIFMTDGLPTVGKTDTAQILSLMNETSIRTFTMGFGYDVNAKLLDAMATKSRAFPTYVQPKEELERTVTNLFSAISSPVLTDIGIECDGVEMVDMYPKTLPDLFAGRELTIAGRYKGNGEATITLKGRAKNNSYAAKASANFPKSDSGSNPIASIWANRKVAYLLDEIRLHGESKELKDEVIALAREFSIVTPYTSMFAAPDEEYAMATDSRNTAARGQLREMSALSAPSGSASVNFSIAQEANRQRSNADVFAPKEVKKSKDDESETAVVKGVSFRRASASARWIDSSLTGNEPTVKVKYLSNAYYDLLRRFPNHRAQILVGEEVELLIKGKRVVISAEGEEEKAPL